MAPRTLHPDLSLHGLYQSRRYGESQACSSIFSRHGTIGLGKGIEDQLLFFRSDANARIANDEMQLHLLRETFFQRDFEDYLPGGREFDGVSQQIDDDLANSNGIGDHIVGNTHPPLAQQFEILLVRAYS